MSSSRSEAARLPLAACSARYPGAPEEADLVQRAQRDAAAFGDLYRRHYDAIAGYLFRRTGDRHATEDLLQETFLAALKGLSRYRDRGVPFRFWLYRIATNTVNRWARRRRGRARSLDEVREVIDPRVAEPCDEAAFVRARMLGLPPRYQAVLALYYLEGLSVEQVALAVGVRPGTVKSRLARARDALRARLTRGEES